MAAAMKVPATKVRTTKTRTTTTPDNGGGDQAPQGTPGHPHRMQSLGSGFIVDPSGIIITNNHVIDGADEISVTLQDDTTLKATLIGRDDRNDIAVLAGPPGQAPPFGAFRRQRREPRG